MEKKYKFIISDAARRMLGEHIRFLKQVNPKTAAAKKEQIMKAMQSLTFQPERFPYFNVPEIPANLYRKMFIEKWYIVLYQIKDDTVYVDYILDCRKEYPWLMSYM